MIALWIAALGFAATPGHSEARIEADRISVFIDGEEFADRFPTGDLQAVAPLLIAHTMASTWISVDGERCQIGRPTVARSPEEEEDVVIAAPILCDPGTRWRYFPSWVRGRAPGHEHEVFAFGERVGVVLRDDPAIDLVGAPVDPTPRPAYVVAGVGAAGLGLAGCLALLGLVIWRSRS